MDVYVIGFDVILSTVSVIGISTVAATSRYYGYQPELDGEEMKKYL